MIRSFGMSLHSRLRASPSHTGPSLQRKPVARRSTAALPTRYRAKLGSTMRMAGSGYRTGWLSTDGSLASAPWYRAGAPPPWSQGAQPMRELVQRFNELCDALPFTSSWYLKDLATGARADRLGGVPVPSASTRKISIMMAALAAVHAGKLSLDQKVTVEAKYQDNDSGTFQHLTPGFWITFRDALVMMIIVSDNTSTGMVVDQVGLEAVQRYC